MAVQTSLTKHCTFPLKHQAQKWSQKEYETSVISDLDLHTLLLALLTQPIPFKFKLYHFSGTFNLQLTLEQCWG